MCGKDIPAEIAPIILSHGFVVAEISSESEISTLSLCGEQKSEAKLLTPIHPATCTRRAAHTVSWYQQSLDDDDCANKIMF